MKPNEPNTPGTEQSPGDDPQSEEGRARERKSKMFNMRNMSKSDDAPKSLLSDLLEEFNPAALARRIRKMWDARRKR